MPVTEGIICIFSAYYSAYYLHIIGADAAQPVLAGVGGGFAHHISRKEGFGMANMIRMGSLYLDDPKPAIDDEAMVAHHCDIAVKAVIRFVIS